MELIRVTSLLPVRLNKYLLELYPALTPGRLNKALRENKLKLNGKKQPLSTRVQAGDEIKLFLLPDQLQSAPPADGPAFLQAKHPAKVVYEDDQLLIADKPAGLAVSDDCSTGPGSIFTSRAATTPPGTLPPPCATGWTPAPAAWCSSQRPGRRWTPSPP